MTTQLDYYRILQVHPDAEKEVIDAAYRRLAFKYHPDKSTIPDTAERMKHINIAYEVLSDPVKRVAYDATRGKEHLSDTQTYASSGVQHRSRSWKIWATALVVILLTVVTFRLAPSLMLLIARLILPILVIFLVVWLIFTLTNKKQ